MAKEFSKPSLIMFVLLVVLCFCGGCSDYNRNSNVNYEYLYEDDYGKNSVMIIRNTNELLQYDISDQYDLTKYDESFFLNNCLLLFKFKIHYSESNLEIESIKIVDEKQILLNILIDSPANYENNSFDAQISIELLHVDIPKHALKEIDKLNVGILVKNIRFEDIYCSVYYNCKKSEEI